MKGWLYRFTALSVGVFAALLLAEGAVRLLAPQKLVRPCVQPDNELGLRYLPHCCFRDDWHPEWFVYSVCTNNLGLRMPEDVHLGGRPRWLWLGDSFTFGWGVDQGQSWLGLLDSLLVQRGCPLQLVNGGHPAWSTGHQVLFLERMLPHVQPQRVWYVFHETDPFDNMQPQAPFGLHVQGDTLHLYRRPARTGWRAWLNRQAWYVWLLRHSHFFVLVQRVLTGRLGQRRQPRAYAELPRQPQLAAQTTRVMLAQVDSLIALCRKAQVPFGLVWLPSMQELPLDFPEGWQATYSLRHLKDTLRNHLRRAGVPFVDLTPAFRKKISGYRTDELYFPEAHLTPLGNRLLCESLLASPPLGTWLQRCAPR